MKALAKAIFISISVAFLVSQSHAAGTSSGLILAGPFGARAASLGESFSAVTNDVTAFNYNPASLRSLADNQASLMYQKGIADDTFAQLMIGTPSLGLSFGYYNAGDAEVFDGQKTLVVNAKTDMNLCFGYAHQWGKTRMGISGKYIRSQLAETKNAAGFAGDLGVQFPLSARMNAGIAIQNFGTKLKYSDTGDDLPRTARAGVALALLQGKNPVTLLLDAPYSLNDSAIHPSAGLEYAFGPLALRAGYKQNKQDLEKFTFGAGFNLGRITMDYAYGLVEELDATHRVSMGVKF